MVRVERIAPKPEPLTIRLSLTDREAEIILSLLGRVGLTQTDLSLEIYKELQALGFKEKIVRGNNSVALGAIRIDS